MNAGDDRELPIASGWSRGHLPRRKDIFQPLTDGTPWRHLLPTPEAVRWRALAEMLAKTNRFAGATPGVAYSVAQHSVIGCDHFRDTTLKLWFLLHDAHEPVAGGDIVSPVKAAFHYFGVWEAFERFVALQDRAVFLAAGLPPAMPDDVAARVKAMDYAMYATECRDLGPPRLVVDPVDYGDPLPTVIRAWPWQDAMDAWLDRLATYCPAAALQLADETSTGRSRPAAQTTRTPGSRRGD